MTTHQTPDTKHQPQDVFVSVVVVLRSYARFLPAFVEEVTATLEVHYTNYELILVDNGARDDTPRVVRELLSRYKCIRCLRLSRRQKPETAVMAGLDAAIGDFVVTLHPEFDPPAELPALVEVAGLAPTSCSAWLPSRPRPASSTGSCAGGSTGPRGGRSARTSSV